MSRMSYYDQTRTEMLDYIPRDAVVVLEVGCGSGVFGQLLSEGSDREVWGVEKSAEAGIESKKVLKGVFLGTLEEYFASRQINKGRPGNKDAIFEQTFDCIIFNDVLEHMVDPWECLRMTRDILCDDGVVVASIPNIRYFRVLKSIIFKKDFKYTEKGVLDKSHLRFFTKKSIIRMIEECDYELVKIEGINKTRNMFMRIVNFILLRYIDDVLYPQYAIVAKYKC